MSNSCQYIRLGDYIEARNERNSGLQYGIDLIEGVNSNGEFQQTKAITDGIDLKPYKAVYEGDIVYNPSRLNIGSLAFRENGMGMCIVSHLYQVFFVKEKYADILLPEYLMLYFNRNEFSRLVDYSNFGSQRAEFNLKKLGELIIPLPRIEAQRKIIEVWKSLRSIKKHNEEIVEPLMSICKSYVQKLKHSYPKVVLGDYLDISDQRNRDLEFSIFDLKGVNSEGKIINTIANTSGLDVSNYKVIRSHSFAYSNRINLGSIALNYGEDCITSPSYSVFRIKESMKNTLLDEYLFLWFRRSEFLRSTLFYAFGTIKDDFSLREMCRVEIPLPPFEIQQNIVNVFNCALEAKRIAEEADLKSHEICPALIQYAIHN